MGWDSWFENMAFEEFGASVVLLDDLFEFRMFVPLYRFPVFRDDFV
jgi:hypothetical protein